MACFCGIQSREQTLQKVEEFAKYIWSETLQVSKAWLLLSDWITLITDFH